MCGLPPSRARYNVALLLVGCQNLCFEAQNCFEAFEGWQQRCEMLLLLLLFWNLKWNPERANWVQFGRVRNTGRLELIEPRLDQASKHQTTIQLAASRDRFAAKSSICLSICLFACLLACLPGLNPHEERLARLNVARAMVALREAQALLSCSRLGSAINLNYQLAALSW